jgi:hypothetical protein
MAVNADHTALFVKAVEAFVISLFVWHATSSFSSFGYLLEEEEKVKTNKNALSLFITSPFPLFAQALRAARYSPIALNIELSR